MTLNIVFTSRFRRETEVDLGLFWCGRDTKGSAAVWWTGMWRRRGDVLPEVMKNPALTGLDFNVANR